MKLDLFFFLADMGDLTMAILFIISCLFVVFLAPKRPKPLAIVDLCIY
jgi:hypothetical protein